MHMLNLKNMLSVKALAERYGLSIRSVYHYVRMLKVPHVRIGRRVLVDPLEFERRVFQRVYYADES